MCVFFSSEKKETVWLMNVDDFFFFVLSILLVLLFQCNSTNDNAPSNNSQVLNEWTTHTSTHTRTLFWLLISQDISKYKLCMYMHILSIHLSSFNSNLPKNIRTANRPKRRQKKNKNKRNSTKNEMMKMKMMFMAMVDHHHHHHHGLWDF